MTKNEFEEIFNELFKKQNERLLQEVDRIYAENENISVNMFFVEYLKVLSRENTKTLKDLLLKTLPFDE